MEAVVLANLGELSLEQYCELLETRKQYRPCELCTAMLDREGESPLLARVAPGHLNLKEPRMADKIGQCISCKEWCALDEPCCNSGIYYEGDIVYPEESDEPTQTL